MKMRKISKVYLHYVSDLTNTKDYHFVIDELPSQPLSLMSASPIDGDIEALHIASLTSESMPMYVGEIMEALQLTCDIIIVEEAPKKKKK
jgi:hypothetical protein